MLIAVVKIGNQRELVAAHGIIQGYLGEFDYETEYAECRIKPHYPVPAIIEWYEFCITLPIYKPGTDYFVRYVELVHMSFGRYPA